MPYANLPDDAFWKLCHGQDDGFLSSLYKPGFHCRPGDTIATAGSCFAQHFGSWVKRSNLRFLNVEPGPALMTQATARSYGYDIYSARYGNIYSARQLRQLVEDSLHQDIRDCAIWEQGEKWFDGLRPQIEPDGYPSREELFLHRRTHLKRVHRMFRKADVFVFTLGLTEAWQDRDGTIFPTAPGVIAGRFDPAQHSFVNFRVSEVIDDLTQTVEALKRLNHRLRVLLTVSPVPLTATASGDHVVQATTYSKSVLRVAANEVAGLYDHVDYFPSYEIITNPMFSTGFYDANLRTVKPEGVRTVMSTFFGAHPGLAVSPDPDEIGDTRSGRAALPEDEDADDELVCEELLLEAFARR